MLCLVPYSLISLGYASFLCFGFWVGCRSSGLGLHPYTQVSIKVLDYFLCVRLCFVFPFPCVYVWIHACLPRSHFLHPFHDSHVLFPFVGLCLLVFGAFLFVWFYHPPFMACLDTTLCERTS